MPLPGSLRRAALVVCLTAACSVPPPAPPYAARPVVEVARFDIRLGAERLGTLQQLELQDPAGAVRFYRVLDARGAWVGHVSEQGRVTKRVPFAEDEEDLGLWALAKGVAALFDRTGAVDLVPLPIAAEASARK